MVALLARLVYPSTTTPAQVLSNAAFLGGLSRYQLEAAKTMLLAKLLYGSSVTPSQVLADAAAYAGYFERELAELRTQRLALLLYGANAQASQVMGIAANYGGFSASELDLSEALLLGQFLYGATPTLSQMVDSSWAGLSALEMAYVQTMACNRIALGGVSPVTAISAVDPSAAGPGQRGNIASPFTSLSAAQTASLPGDIVDIVSALSFSAQVSLSRICLKSDYTSTPPTVGLTNSLANVDQTPSFKLSDGAVYGFVMTNSAPGNSDVGSVVGAAQSKVATVVDCVFHGNDMSLQFKDGLPLGSVPAFVRNCTFNSTVGIDLWRRPLYLFNCTYNTTDGGHICNDDSFSSINNSTFVCGPAGDGQFGVIHYARSRSVFNNCTFSLDPATTKLFLMLWNAEPGASGYYKNCTFNLQAADGVCQLLSCNGDGGFYVDGRITFDNCTVSPQTGGVLVDNSTSPITVIGGNLVAANFSNPATVTFS